MAWLRIFQNGKWTRYIGFRTVHYCCRRTWKLVNSQMACLKICQTRSSIRKASPFEGIVLLAIWNVLCEMPDRTMGNKSLMHWVEPFKRVTVFWSHIKSTIVSIIMHKSKSFECTFCLETPLSFQIVLWQMHSVKLSFPVLKFHTPFLSKNLNGSDCLDIWIWLFCLTQILKIQNHWKILAHAKCSVCHTGILHWFAGLLIWMFFGNLRHEAQKVTLKKLLVEFPHHTGLCGSTVKCHCQAFSVFHAGPKI